MTNEQLTDWDYKKTLYQNGIVIGAMFDSKGHKIKDQEINIEYWVDSDGVIMITNYEHKEQAQETLESFFSKTKFYLL